MSTRAQVTVTDCHSTTIVCALSHGPSPAGACENVIVYFGPTLSWTAKRSRPWQIFVCMENIRGQWTATVARTIIAFCKISTGSRIAGVTGAAASGTRSAVMTTGAQVSGATGAPLAISATPDAVPSATAATSGMPPPSLTIHPILRWFPLHLVIVDVTVVDGSLLVWFR
jgi:hypothetical protein